ncbi:MAG: RibD family protein, partial [Flavisolibacter sp.]
FTFHQSKRPYIILKWAQTADGFIGNEDHSRLLISTPQTNRIVHKWRAEEMSILVGTNTALFDDPLLTTRLWPGSNPVRLVIDLHLRLPMKLRIFDDGLATIVFNLHQHTIPDNSNIKAIRNNGLFYYQVTDDTSLVHQVLNGLYQSGITSVLVEGGAQVLQSFIDEGAWDEMRVIKNLEMKIIKGVRAPVLNAQAGLTMESKQGTEILSTYKNNQLY